NASFRNSRGLCPTQAKVNARRQKKSIPGGVIFIEWPLGGLWRLCKLRLDASRPTNTPCRVRRPLAADRPRVGEPPTNTKPPHSRGGIRKISWRFPAISRHRLADPTTKARPPSKRTVQACGNASVQPVRAVARRPQSYHSGTAQGPEQAHERKRRSGYRRRGE